MRLVTWSVWVCGIGIASTLAACGETSETPEVAAVGSSVTPEGTSSNTTSVDSLPIDTSPHSYEADDPSLQFTGRIDWSDPKAPTFSLGATRLTAHFSGTGMSVVLVDEFKWDTSRNWLDVFVDGVFSKKIAAEEGQEVYELAAGLPEGEHTVVLSKRTEPNIGQVTIKGVEVAGALLAPPARPSRRIQVVGDSITAGSGAEAANNSDECTEDAWNQTGGSGWGQPYHNANVSYGSVVAELLQAEAHVLGVSGIGLVRNYSSKYDARPMPEVYGLLYPETKDGPTYDATEFVPDVVILALGTNDFSPGDNEPDDPREHMEIEAFVDAYVAFIDNVRALYPEAHVVLSSSPMLGDGWPEAEDTFRQDQLDAITTTVQHYVHAGVTLVSSYEAPRQSGDGCGTHPNVAQQREVGEGLAAHVGMVMGWN